MNTLLRCLVVGLALLFFRCSGDPNEKANELYVQAVQLVRSAKQVGSYSEALPLYEQAGDRIERIASQYSGSNIAVNLISGQTRISNLTLSEFQELEGLLKRLADAEQDPFSCALVIVETIKKESRRADALTIIAEGLAKAEHFVQALDIAHTVKDELKADGLTYIAVGLAKAGYFSQALNIANTIEDESSKAWALGGIGANLTKVGQQPNESDVAILREIVQTAIPMEKAWERIKKNEPG